MAFDKGKARVRMERVGILWVDMCGQVTVLYC